MSGPVRQTEFTNSSLSFGSGWQTIETDNGDPQHWGSQDSPVKIIYGFTFAAYEGSRTLSPSNARGPVKFVLIRGGTSGPQFDPYLYLANDAIFTGSTDYNSPHPVAQQTVDFPIPVDVSTILANSVDPSSVPVPGIAEVWYYTEITNLLIYCSLRWSST